MLLAIGYQVEVIDEYDDVLSYLSHHTYHLILLDCLSVGMNIIDITLKIKKVEEYKALPIVAIIPTALKENKIKRVKDNVNGYLFRPLKQENLAEFIGKYYL